MRDFLSGESDHLSRGEAAHAAAWMGRHLMGDLHDDVYLRLRFVRDLPGRTLAQMGALAYNYPHRHLFIDIDVRRRKRRGQLINLAHEMVHVWQCARGDMCMLDEGIVWRGAQGGYNPSEDEAYAMETPVYRAYAEHLKSVYSGKFR